MIPFNSDFTYYPLNNLNKDCFGTFKAKGLEYTYKGKGTRKEAKLAAKQFAKHKITDKNFTIENFSFKQVNKKSSISRLVSDSFIFIYKAISFTQNTEEKNSIINKNCNLELSKLELEEINTDDDEKIKLEEFIYIPHQRLKTQSKENADGGNMLEYHKKNTIHNNKEIIKKSLINLNQLTNLKRPLNLNEYEKYKNCTNLGLDILLKDSNYCYCSKINLPKNLELAEKLVNLFYFILHHKIDCNLIRKNNFFYLVDIIQQLAGDQHTGNLLLLNAHPEITSKELPGYDFGVRCYLLWEESFKNYLKDSNDENHRILVKNIIKRLEKFINENSNSTNPNEKISKTSCENAFDKGLEQGSFEELNIIGPLYLLQRLKKLEMK